MATPSGTHIETSRLQLRNIEMNDIDVMFELDSDPQVVESIGSGVSSKEEAAKYISFVQQQYKINGFGRWAVVLKETGEVMGWAGLKLESNVNGHDSFYDLGYRFLPRYWNQGFASEASIALLEYGFKTLKCDKICAYVEELNPASRRVCEKVGLKHVSTFQGDRCNELWLEITKEEHEQQQQQQQQQQDRLTAISPT
jgi:[ribosomal protein S5]-alanine N-acetyltransferase